MDREQLYSLEVERNIIGAMILEVKSCVQVLESGVREEAFYNTAHQIIFRNIKEIFKEKTTVDLLMLIERLKEKDLLKDVNGISYVTDISTSVISTENIQSYIEMLKEYSQKRKLLSISNYIQLNMGKRVEDIQQEVTGLLADLMDERNSNETAENQDEEYIKILEKRLKGENAPIKTGIWDIDNKINGFSGGDLVTIFAFSGVGKTALATQITLNNVRQNKRVLFFSLEMAKEQIRDRVICNMTNIPFANVKYPKTMNSNQLDKVIKASAYLSANNRLLVSEEDELLNIISKIQLEVMKNNIDIIFIDYINLINIMGNNKEEHYRVAECTRLLKKLALKINKPIVILAQGKQEQASKMLNENYSIWEKVAVNDIAGGASIYRDSDIVIGMYRNTELDNKLVREKLKDKIDYSKKHADINPECMNLLIKKSRASGKDIIATKWKAENYRISNWY